jgi:hypothetical protein
MDIIRGCCSRCVPGLETGFELKTKTQQIRRKTTSGESGVLSEDLIGTVEDAWETGEMVEKCVEDTFGMVLPWCGKPRLFFQENWFAV